MPVAQQAAQGQMQTTVVSFGCIFYCCWRHASFCLQGLQVAWPEPPERPLHAGSPPPSELPYTLSCTHPTHPPTQQLLEAQAQLQDSPSPTASSLRDHLRPGAPKGAGQSGGGLSPPPCSGAWVNTSDVALEDALGLRAAGGKGCQALGGDFWTPQGSQGPSHLWPRLLFLPEGGGGRTGKAPTLFQARGQ